MALILNIETSTSVCSASISKNGETLALRESFDGKSHGTLLTVFVDELFIECNLTAKEIDAVAVSEGPGSYTGLRIGVSVAKGICYAANKPLIAVNTLKSMALMAIDKYGKLAYQYCSMIDARRMEVYSAVFDNEANVLRKTVAKVIDNDSYKNELSDHKIAFYGDGAFKCKDAIMSENAVFIENIYPSAQYMAKLSAEAYLKEDFKDVAYFEPFYLKDFVATTPKKKVL